MLFVMVMVIVIMLVVVIVAWLVVEVVASTFMDVVMMMESMIVVVVAVVVVVLITLIALALYLKQLVLDAVTRAASDGNIGGGRSRIVSTVHGAVGNWCRDVSLFRW